MFPSIYTDFSSFILHIKIIGVMFLPNSQHSDNETLSILMRSLKSTICHYTSLAGVGKLDIFCYLDRSQMNLEQIVAAQQRERRSGS